MLLSVRRRRQAKHILEGFMEIGSALIAGVLTDLFNGHIGRRQQSGSILNLNNKTPESLVKSSNSGISYERRRRDLNPRAAINDLLPFQGSPFGQLGYFSTLPE